MQWFQRGALALILFWTFVCVGHAGHYEVSYSGGSVEIVGPHGATWGYAYGPTSDGGWGGSGISEDPGDAPGTEGLAGPGSVKCSGEVTILFTWVPDGPGDNAPASTIVSIASQAGWTGSSGEAIADVDGETKVTLPTAEEASGTSYQVVASPGGHIEPIHISPLARAVLPQSFGDVLAARAHCFVKATATPAEIVLEGTSRTFGADHILMGQNIRTHVSAGGYALSNFRWQLSHAEYFNAALWGISNSAHLYVRPNASFWSQPSLSYYYINTGNESIRCSVDVIVGGRSIGNLALEKPISVLAPDFTFDVKWIGDQSYDRGDDGAVKSIGSGGINFRGSAETPPEFGATGTDGRWAYAQLCDLHRFQTLASGQPNLFATNGFMLDNGFPYSTHPGSTGIFPACSLADFYYEGDDPSHSIGPHLGTYDQAFEIHDTYWMFQAYTPPPSPAGLPTEWVPLKVIDWQWNSAASRVGNLWPSPSGGISVISEHEYPEWLFQWGIIYTNTQTSTGGIQIFPDGSEFAEGPIAAVSE